MSIDYTLCFDAPVPRSTLREWLVTNHGLRSEAGSASSAVGWLTGEHLSVLVRRLDEEDQMTALHRVEGRLLRIGAVLKFLPGRGSVGGTALNRVLGDALATWPGDAYVEMVDHPQLLRRGGVVYLDPDGIRPSDLAEGGYMPERVVLGIPPPDPSLPPPVPT